MLPPPSPGAPPPPPTLLSLPDHLLRAILARLAPCPDRFSAAAACRRLRGLAADPRSRLEVEAGAAPRGGGAAAAAAARRFASLAAAVAASSAGDTIVLRPGVHAVAVADAPVVVLWPLSIVGDPPCGSSAAGAPTLAGPPGAGAVLEFRASGRLANVAVAAVGGACVAHRAGLLSIEGCRLRVDAARCLAHIVSPLATTAVAAPAAGAPAPPCAPGSGPGALIVCDTEVRGTVARAVSCGGSGAPRRVRAIPGATSTLLWLEVDACDPGQPPAPAAAAAAALPLGRGAGEGACRGGPAGDACLDAKAAAWSRHQEAALLGGAGSAAAGGDPPAKRRRR